MSNYFKNVTKQSELREKFRELCKQLHPDCGGDGELFKEMVKEYKKLLVKLANCDDKSQWAAKEEAKKATKYADLIAHLQKFSGIVIEICGSWLWLHGNTKEYAKEISQLGFKWSGNKKSWYWAPYLSKNKVRGSYSMEKIRKVYGSETYNSEEREQIAATD